MKFSKALRYIILFSVVCFLLSAFVIYVNQRISRAYENNLPLVRLSDYVKGTSTAAAIQYQAWLGGQKSIDNQQSLASLQRSQQILQAAYDGNRSAFGNFVKSENENTRALIKEATIDVEQLQNTIKSGLEEFKDSEASATDAKFSSSFAKLISSLDKLSAHLQNLVQLDQGRIRTLAWLSVLILLGGLGLLGFVLYRSLRENDKKNSEHERKLQDETKRVGTLSRFIEAVSAGNYDIEMENAQDDDNLTTTLINMRDKLRQNSDDDRKRNWATTGQAQIGEILRATASTTADLYDNIIRFLVKYTKSNQGGLFILNEDSDTEKFLELVACYAFERKKFLSKKVTIGDGLVGQCFLEGQTIHLLEVPQDYISITSGLGGSNPSSLLIVPMKVNDHIYGVIELASFKKYEPYEVELVEKLAESIASTISNVRVNDTTRILLEKTQQQAEEMKSQEEEIRQNMEELEATQEEMRRKQTVLERELDQSQKQSEALRVQEKRITESQETLQAIVDNIPRAIFWKDKDLRFQGCNKIFSDIAGEASPRDLTGKTDFDMAWSAQADAYRKDDMEVMKSRISKLDIEEVNINSEGEESWVKTSKVPIITATGEVVAILGMFEDITAQKRKEADVAQKLKERETALQELEKLRSLLTR